MLSQRMAKDKIYNDNTSTEEGSRRGLISAVVQFENNLSTLKGMSLSPVIENELIHIELLWMGYKQIVLDEEEDEDSSSKIMEFNNVILSASQKVFTELLNTAKKQKSYPYNSKQTSFSPAYIAANNLKHTGQRLALYYTSYFYKVSKYNNPVFEKIVSDIEQQVQQIEAVKNLSTEYIESTNAIISEWTNIKNLLKDVRTKRFISVHTSPNPEIIYEGSNKLLKHSDMLSRTYKAVNEINN